jgi:hypothetical protein
MSAPYQPFRDRHWPWEQQQQQQQHHGGVKVGKAIYFLTNEAENAVVALPIGKDGMLSAGTVIKTGGAGSASINGKTGQPAAPDSLVGQSALTVAGNVCCGQYVNEQHY